MEFQMPGLIGRKEEMKALGDALSLAAEGAGNTIIVSGEAGIGKSRLIEEFKAGAGCRLLSGAAEKDSLEPFRLFSSALEGLDHAPLFSHEEHKGFSAVFAVNRAGLLVAQASQDDGLDGDIFAGMFTAVQAFVKDSLDSDNRASGGLGRLEYGDLKIIIEQGQHIFLTAVFKGAEHEDMKLAVRRTLAAIEEQHSGILETWAGMMEEVEPIASQISALSESKFLVRRDMEGLKLEEERLKIADRVLDTLTSLAEEDTVLLLLEDLHWADESSLFVLEYIARNITASRIMTLATTRPMEDGLEAVLEHGRLMPLFGLGDKGLRDMLDEIFSGHDFPENFTSSIMEKCEGNPFFFLELVRHLWEQGSIVEKEGKFTLVSRSLTIPSTIEDIALNRLSSLGPQALKLAEYSSCIGKSFDRELAMSLEDVDEPGEAIETLVDAGILISSNGAIEFSHAIYHEVIYSGLSGRWRAVYHKRLGEFCEDNYDTNRVIYQLARHFSMTREHDKAFRYCFVAGEKAESSFAAEFALEFYLGAGKHLPSLPDPQFRDQAERALLVRLGDLYKFTGQIDQALETYAKALKKESETRPKALIFRKIAEVNHRIGDYEKSREACEAGLELLDGQVCSEAEKLYSTLGWNHIRTGRHSLALELLNKGLEMAVQTKDKGGIANAQHNIGSVMLHKGEYEKAIEHFEKALDIRSEIDDIWNISATLNNLGNSYMGLGDLQRALDYYQRSVENSKRIGDNRALSISLTNMGSIVACLGDLDKSLEYYQESHELKRKFDDKWGMSTTLENIGTVQFTFGEMDKALENYQESLEIRKKINDTAGIALSHINIGELFYYTGRPEGAHENYAKALDIATETNEKWLIIVANYRIAESHLGLGDQEEAEAHAKVALKLSRETSSRSEEARSLQALGNIYAAKGDFQAAGENLARTKVIFQETGEKGEVAKVAFDIGQMHVAMGELDKARAELEEALALFEETNAEFFAGRSRNALQQLDQQM